MKTTVFFEDGTARKYLPQTVAEQGLFPGQELEEEDLSRLRVADGAASAKQRAVRIISTVGVTRQELAHRLTQKGETQTDAENAVRWLEDLDLLNDAEIARQVVARGVARGYGAERIRQMLYEKRVPRSEWDRALDTMPDMTEALTEFLRRRLGEDPDEKQRRSAFNAALRRGYTWQEVRSALERLDDREEADAAFPTDL